MRMMRLRNTLAICIVALVSILAPSERAFAQEEPAPSEGHDPATPLPPGKPAPPETWAEGYTLPDAPAATLLNVHASLIQEPGSAQKFGAALLSAITSQGSSATGVALEASGRGLFGFGNDWTQYKNSYLERFLARVSLSLAMGPSPVTPTTTLVALGLRLVFLDGSDPLTDPAYSTYVLDAKKRCPPTSKPSEMEAHQKCLDKLPQLTAPAWNASGLALAAATSVALANGTLSQGSWADTGAWLTGSLGLGTVVQISAAAEFRHASGTSQNIGAVALRVRGGGKWLRGSLEGAYATANPSDPEDRKGKLMVGVDAKLTTGVWLNASIGGDYNFTGSPFRVFTLASLKYAFAGTPDIIAE